jgi:hypothetical protein
MRIFGLGCLLMAGVTAGGCFQMTTLVKVNGDGSGTIDHSMVLSKAALAQLRGMAGLTGRNDRAQIDFTSEDQARAMAGALGTGVTYLSSEPIDTASGQGRRSLYAFADISQLKISQQPESPGGIRSNGRAHGGDITCTLTHEPNGNAVVHINLPEIELPDIGRRSASGDTPARNTALLQQFAMARALLAGAKLQVAMEPAGLLVRTSSPYVEGSQVTLLDVDLDQLLANEAVLTRLQEAANPEELRAALKDVPGLKMPLEREVTIEFTPAK